MENRYKKLKSCKSEMVLRDDNSIDNSKEMKRSQ
jgi:hypothetical protein